MNTAPADTEFDDTDPDAFKKWLGLEESNNESTPRNGALGDSDKDILDTIGKQAPTGMPPTPTGGTGTAAPEGLPAYLADTIKDVADAPAPIDWAAQYKTDFGEELPQGADEPTEAYFQTYFERDAEEFFLQETPGYRDSKALVLTEYGTDDAGKEQETLHNISLIRSRVTQELGVLAEDEAEVDRRMGVFVAEGELTEQGRKLAKGIRSEVKNWVNTVEQKARQFGVDEAADKIAARRTIREGLDKFTAAGVTLEDADRDTIKDTILSGRLTQALVDDADKQTPDQQAWHAIVENPRILAKVLAAHYERGAKEGAARRLARQLN